MNNRLKDLYDSLLQLQTEIEMNNFDIAEAEKKFNEFINNTTEEKQSREGIFLSSFASNVDELEKREEIIREYKGKMIGYGIVLVLGIPMIPVSIFVPIPFFSPLTVLTIMFLTFLFKRKSIKEFFEAIVDYRRIKVHVKKMNSRGEYQQLLDMHDEVKKLRDKKRKNHEELERLKAKFIYTLQEEMYKKYQELGIEEKVKIESASLVDGSSAGITLEFKPSKDYLD